MHKIVLKIHEYLESAAKGNVTVDEKLIDEFGERVKAKLRKQLEPRSPDFRLRMSNIGRPLRQLMLEQKYGASTPPPDFMLKMMFGDLYESLFIYLAKASGLEITEQDTKVSLPVKTVKGVVNVEGELDLGIKVDGEDGIYDVKSASPWSYDNKFNPDSMLTGDDAFGYVDQLFQYAAARNKKAKGWIPINKSDGQIKVTEIPKDSHDVLMEKSKETVKNKVCHIVEGKPMPECDGVIEETFFGKATGNKVLGPKCKFCNYKNKCHAEIVYLPEAFSKAKERKWKWYIGKVIKPKEIKNG